MTLRIDAAEVAVGQVCIAGVDDVIVVANPVIGIRFIHRARVEGQDGIDGVLNELCTIHQIATTFTEDDIALSNVLQAAEDTPVGIEGVRCQVAGFDVAVHLTRQHIFAGREGETRYDCEKENRNNLFHHDFELEVDGNTYIEAATVRENTRIDALVEDAVAG